MARFLASRLQRLEAKCTPQFRPMPVVRFNPRTRELLDPIPTRPFIPEPHFVDEADWEAYNQKTRAALMRHMPQGT